MDRLLPTFSIEELEKYWGELDKLDRVEAKARLDYALLVRRTMIELSDLLNCPVKKIQARVENLIEENNSLKLQVRGQTCGADPVTEPDLHESWKGLPSEPEPGAEVPNGPLKPAEDYGANVPKNERVGRAGTGIPVEGKFIINKLTPEIPAEKTYPPIPKRSDDSEEPNDHYAVGKIPAHDIGELLWWVNSDCESIQVEVIDNTFLGYTIKDTDTGELFYDIKPKLLLHLKVYSLASAEIRLAEQILDKRQELDDLLEKRRISCERQVDRESCND